MTWSDRFASLNDIQLTAENVEGAVEELSDTIAESENNEAEQNNEVLGRVAEYFDQLTNFLTQPNVTVTSTVRKVIFMQSLSLLSYVTLIHP